MRSELISFFYVNIVLLSLPFWVSIIDKKIGRKLGLAIVVTTTMDRCGAMATMTLAPLDFFFPSATTTIVKMKVDQRWISVEGLKFGVVKTEMVLELEVVGTGDVKKP